jgi:hypothetical protein
MMETEPKEFSFFRAMNETAMWKAPVATCALGEWLERGTAIDSYLHFLTSPDHMALRLLSLCKQREKLSGKRNHLSAVGSSFDIQKRRSFPLSSNLSQQVN